MFRQQYFITNVSSPSDVMDKATQRHNNMAAIRSSGTKPERIVR